MDILTLKSKVKLGCNLCDKCCIYRGDIRLLPINVWRISKYLNIPVKEFLNKYTERPENNNLELVLKTTGELKQCILYDENEKKCGIHPVKPLQCVMFPLVPENLKRDYFVDSGQCKLEDAKDKYRQQRDNHIIDGHHHNISSLIGHMTQFIAL